MKPLSRRKQATLSVTALGHAWLWHKRGCRAMADELGVWGRLGVARLGPGGGALWRADLAGVAKRGNSYRLDILEVKGTREDLRREDLGAGKWLWSRGITGAALWVLMGEDLRPEDYAAVPAHWGLLQAAEDNTVVKTLRRPKSESWLDAQEVTESLYWLGYRSLVSGLPFLGRSTAQTVALFHDRLGVDFEEHETAFSRPEVDLSLDEHRVYPVAAVIDDGTGPLSQLADGWTTTVGLRGLDGRVIGAVQVVKAHGVVTCQGQIDYQSPERRLLESQDPDRPAFSVGTTVKQALLAD